MRILVTGAAGHVGGEIAQHLAKAGHEVVGTYHWKPPAQFTEGVFPSVKLDLAAPDAADALAEIEPCDAVVHAAAKMDGAASDRALMATNCEGTRLLLEAFERWKGHGFVFISTIAVIGQPRYFAVTEDHPLDPRTPYAATKLFGEHLAFLSAAPSRAALRITAPVGHRMRRERILPVFIRRALTGEPIEILGKGTRQQDYVDGRDIARAVDLALSSGASGVFNIGSGHPVSNLTLAERVIAATSSTSKIQYSESPDPEEGIAWNVSIEKARRELGYSPAVSLDESIAEVASALCESL